MVVVTFCEDHIIGPSLLFDRLRYIGKWISVLGTHLVRKKFIDLSGGTCGLHRIFPNEVSEKPPSVSLSVVQILPESFFGVNLWRRHAVFTSKEYRQNLRH
jgi:hypothetical protein